MFEKDFEKITKYVLDKDFIENMLVCKFFEIFHFTWLRKISRFRKKQFSIKNYAIIHITNVFENYDQRKYFRKQCFREYWALNKNFRKHELEYDFENFHKDCEKLSSKKKFLYKNLSNLKTNVRFFCDNKIQWFRPVIKINKHQLDITNMLLI